jgi:hypothetical protein
MLSKRVHDGEMSEMTTWPRVESADLSSMVVYSVRYALSRRTYVPAEACDFVRKYWDSVRLNDRACLERDIRNHIEIDEARMKPDAGFDMYHHDLWADLLQWMERGRSREI